MKSIRTASIALVLACLSFIATAQMPSGIRVNNAETILMTNNMHRITLAQTTQPLTPVTLTLTFKSAGSNNFNFSYIRGTYTNVVVNRMLTNCASYTIFIPRDIKLVTADQLMFNKTRNDNAQLTIVWK